MRGPDPEDAEGRTRFLADAMVADLARWLRILGEDCLWAPPSWSDDQVLEVAREDARVVLTRDDRLVQRCPKLEVECLGVPQGNILDVLLRVYGGLALAPREDLMATRCSLCNGPLVRVDGQGARERALEAGRPPPLEEVLRRHGEFWSCRVCGQPFWRGTHWREIKRVRDRLVQALSS